MFKKRIIPCLDVKDGKVVKGVQFKDHEIVGDIVELAEKYCKEGADELVFYDITASSSDHIIDYTWISKIANIINIPFCVAGGIRTIEQAAIILENGADKISINSPALEKPDLINELATRFGSQAIVVGIDSFEKDSQYFVYQYTGNPEKTISTGKSTIDWAKEVTQRGAGEIVLNCMNQDGMRLGYDIQQISIISDILSIPIIASGGAGTKEHFLKVFKQTKATGALAASVFHKGLIDLGELKLFLSNNEIEIRL
jgi:cyclase